MFFEPGQSCAIGNRRILAPESVLTPFDNQKVALDIVGLQLLTHGYGMTYVHHHNLLVWLCCTPVHPQQYETYKRETADEVLPTMFDIDRLFERKGITDDTLLKLFFGDKFTDKKKWLQHLEEKKITVSTN